MGTLSKLALPALLALGIGTAPAQAALVTNGDFETGDFSGWTQGGDFATDNVFTAPGHVYDGTYSAALGTLTGSTLSQVLNVVAGQTYTLTFVLANAPGDTNASGNNAFSVTLGDETFSLPDNFVAFDYGTFTIEALATSDTLNLAFSFLNNPSDWLLDNVTVETAANAVPEPTTWAMLLVGFGVVGTSMRRRRQVLSFS